MMLMALCGFLLLETSLIIYLIIKIKSKNNIEINQDSYAVYQLTLTSIIQTYKTSKVDPQVKALQRTHDIDVNSPTNSIQLYNQQYNDLIRNSILDIVKNYLSNDLKRYFLKLYGENYLLMLVQNQLMNDEIL